MRNLRTHVPKSHKQPIGATVRTIFVQSDAESARTQLRQVASMLKTRYLKAAEPLAEAEHDASDIRLVDAILAETYDEWRTTGRRYLSEGSINQTGRKPQEVIAPDTPELAAK